MRLSVDRTELELRPGSPARLTAEVHNTGDAAEMVGVVTPSVIDRLRSLSGESHATVLRCCRGWARP